VLTIKSALLSLQSLLSTPEPKDPQDAEVAKMLMNDPEKFQQKARDWAIMHAGAPETTKWRSTATAPVKAQTGTVVLSDEEAQRAQEAR
jgi:ubiquitin-conjugating enzyme (huntingtin interacting protein 2)